MTVRSSRGAAGIAVASRSGHWTPPDDSHRGRPGDRAPVPGGPPPPGAAARTAAGAGVGHARRRSAGSLQFDPLDVTGRNHDLVLAARIDGYRRAWTDDLLYGSRTLYETYNKGLSIVPTAGAAVVSRRAGT